MTLEELNKIKNEYKDLVKVRKVVAEEGEKLAKKTGYRTEIQDSKSACLRENQSGNVFTSGYTLER